MKGPQEKIINKGDWTLGIQSTYWAVNSGLTSFRKNGAATIANTHRCYANPEGVLGPLPLVDVIRTIDTDIGTFPSDLFVGAGTVNNTLVPIEDMVVMGPVTISNDNDASPDASGSGAFVFIAWGFSANITGVNALYQVVRKYDLNRVPVWGGGTAVSASVSREVFLNKYPYTLWTAGVGKLIPRIVLGKGRSSYDSTPSFPPAPAAAQSLPARLIISVAGHSIPNWNFNFLPVIGALAAADATAFADYVADTKTTYSYTDGAAARAGGSLFVWPGYVADPVPIQTGAIPLDSGIFAANNSTVLSSYLDFVSHQGRVVGIVQGNPVISGNSIYYQPGAPIVDADFQDTQLTYTTYPDWIVHSTAPIMFHANPENTSGLGSIGSINASQLLIIKNHNGGMVINGSLDDPTVIQLPYLESSYCLNAHGVNTPIGYVYTSRNGIFIWAGGERSEHLSPQLEGRFWNDWTEVNGEATLMGICGRLAYWHPWVVVPNNYFFDTRTNAWWRTETPDANVSGATKLPFAWADVNPVNNHLILAPYGMRIAEGQAAWAIAEMAPNVFPSSYTFQSQPLIETEMTLTEITEIILTAQRQDTTGTATVVITLSGYKEDGTAITPVDTTFTLASNTLINTYRYVVGTGGAGTTVFGARSIQYKITVSNTSSGDAALIHDLDFVTVDHPGEVPRVS